MTQPKFFTGAPAVHHHAARRLFMRQAGALSMVAGAGAPLALNLLAAGSAAAQSTIPTGGYKAIVCLFMFGGNDSFNMVLPTDAASWAEYRKMRPASSIGLQPVGVLPVTTASAGSPARLGGVLPINPRNPQGRSYALHPLLGKVQTMFGQQRLAVMSNIGPLVQPTTKDEYLFKPSHQRPPRLFSHNDQQSIWQTMQPEGATVGWGGRMADLINGGTAGSTFTAISAAGNAVWLSGDQVRQYQVSGGGALRLGADMNGAVYGSARVAEELNKIVRGTAGGHKFEDYLASVSDRSIQAELDLRSNLLPASNDFFGSPAGTGGYNPKTDPKLLYRSPLSGADEFSPLAHQLQVVARLIEAGNRVTSHPKRQVFFVSVGGFDTHSGQNQTHADLMARLDHALGYFDTALDKAGVRGAVTTFTASDFGRSFTSNGDGTDHGWGAHHLVMGGAVKGGDLYGSFPTLVAAAPGSSDFKSPNQVRNGAMLPTTSVDQLGATLGRWFGVSEDNLKTVFPNLPRFNTAPSNMAFLPPAVG
jgi:uncharacterized protein (DUF1501 family)